MNPAVEQLQIGRYQVYSEVGSDYSGSSFLARDPETNDVVRVRLYRPEYRLDATFAGNFRKDVPRARTPGNDSYMAQPLAWGYAQRIYPYVVFNQLSGKTWGDLVAVRDLNNADMTELCAQAVHSLAAAHSSGLVVGELTPQKLIVARSGGDAEVLLAEPALGRPRLLDLRHSSEDNKLGVGSNALSEYSAPELANVGSEPTTASDVYSMGALLWEMFTGLRFRDAWANAPKPANGKSANPHPASPALGRGEANGKLEQPLRTLKLPHNMPLQLSGFLQRALAIDPGKRFADGSAMYDELAAMQVRERNQKARTAPLTLNTKGNKGETSEWMRRQTRETQRKAFRHGLARAGVALILLVLIGLAIFYGNDAINLVSGMFGGNGSTPPAAAQSTPGAAAVVIGEALPTDTRGPATATAAPATATSNQPTATAPQPTATVGPPLVVPAADGVAAQYQVQLTLDLNQPTIAVQQVVSYTNQQTATISALVFRVVPHHFDGSFNLDQITVNGVAAQSVWLDEVNLSVPLTSTGLTALAGGKSSVVGLHYTLRPLAAGNRFAIDRVNRIITLGDWLPTVVPYQDGRPLTFPYARVGDNGIGTPADYNAQVHTAQPLIIAGSGQQVTRNGNDWTFQVSAGRDFALTASDQFVDPDSDKSLTRTAKDGTVIYGYFLPEHRVRANQILDLSAAAYDWYSAQVGPRNAHRFSIAEMADSLLTTTTTLTATGTPAPAAGTPVPASANDFNLSITSDQEYPDLYLIRAGSVRDEDINPGGFLWWRALHGPAYQWFYADVATNQYSDPWLDEATANYASLYLVSDKYPASFNAEWAVWGNYVPPPATNPNVRTEPTPNSYKPLGAAVNAFAGRDDYFTYIYRQGSAFYRAVKATMGDSNFWQALTAYHQQFSGKPVGGRDLLTVLQTFAPTDLQPIFQQYIGYGSK